MTQTSDLTDLIDLDAAASVLRQAAGAKEGGTPASILVLTHAKPDGDAIGSVLGIKGALEQCGAQVTGLLVPPVPVPLRALPGAADLKIAAEHLEAVAFKDGREPDLIVVCDTSAPSQLGPALSLLEGRHDKTLIIDHHRPGDLPAGWRHIDSGRASCCEIVADLVDRLLPNRPAPVSGEPAEGIDQALYTGLATDTGWFRFSNTSASTHRRAAALMDRGVDASALFELLEQQDPPAKLLLIQRALGSMRLIAGGKAVVMSLSTRDFAETGARPEHTERIVDIPQPIADVRAVALVTQRRDGDDPACRISFRSKPGPDALDVAALAGQFGGGGHVRAAGGGFAGTPNDAADAVAAAFDQALGS